VATADPVRIYQQEAVWLAEELIQTIPDEAGEAFLRRKVILKQVGDGFEQHPDREIFASLPGAGDFLAPALLVKFGDDRQRFPSASSVQALAGTCPVTDSSGKRRVIKFRRACDKQFRHIMQQFARASRQQSVWAKAYWLKVRPGCGSDSHANRCLANRWLSIIWKLWQTNQIYDEAYHLQQRAKRAKARS
jgi:transposase